jgi:hypothetical protein
MRQLYRACGTLLVILAMSSLAGCAVKAIKPQPFDRDRHSDIHTIAVLEMPKVETGVVMLNHPGANFGLIGALVASADMSSMASKLQETMRREKFDPMLYFRQQLTDEMAKRGHTLIWPPKMFEEKAADRSNGLRTHYTSSSNADAQLDLSIGYVGYVAAGAGKDAPYRPSLRMQARLVSKDGNESYFYDTVVYNNAWGIRDAVAMEPHQDFVYPKFDDLQNAGSNSVNGIKHAIDSVTRELASQL